MNAETELTLLNSAGQIVKAAVTEQENSIQVDISGLSQGLYFARITNGSGDITIKKITVIN